MKDKRISPHDYLKCVLNHFDAETEESMLPKILGKVDYILENNLPNFDSNNKEQEDLEV
jgi:hypothetical protein